LGAARYGITIHNPEASGKGIRSADLDGSPLTPDRMGLTIPLHDGTHHLAITLGPAGPPADPVH
jgi:hypothetical protein